MTVSARFYWVEPPDGGRYLVYIQRVKKAMLERAKLFAAEMRSYAKKHRIWTDRTGHARQRLNAKAKWEGNSLVIYLFHQMFYGVFLELRWNGKYAILLPTMKVFFDRIMTALHRLWYGT